MPSLMRIFTTHNNIAEFEPQGPEDVEMAQQATDYVNYVFNKQNNGFKVGKRKNRLKQTLMRT